MSHINTGNCDKCEQILNTFPGFHAELKAWFKKTQQKVKDAHISCAGRGRSEQEAAFQSGASRAHYGESSHNFNCAIDVFRLTLTGASYDRPWFRDSIGTAVYSNNADPARMVELKWYGMPGSKFLELPHIEVNDWKALAEQGLVKLVEP